MRRHPGASRATWRRRAGVGAGERLGGALVGVAFLAVLREGFETAVFLLASFNASGDARPAIGADRRLLLAVVLGYGIYRGGQNQLSKVLPGYRVVLVVIAAGLVMAGVHTARSRLVQGGSEQAFDLSWLVGPARRSRRS